MAKGQMFGRPEGWDAVVALVEAGQRAAAPAVVTDLPVVSRWNNRAGVVLLRDAVHLMPLASYGANQSVLDAV